MSSINKVILVGHLGKDPEVRHLDAGITVASFPLATSETYNKDGKKIEQTEWHNIVMWRGLADIASKYLLKGKLVYIEGKLRTRSFVDKEGQKKYVTEIVADNFKILGRKSDFDSQTEHNLQKTEEEKEADHSNNQLSKEDQPMNYVKGIDDDLPF